MSIRRVPPLHRTARLPAYYDLGGDLLIRVPGGRGRDMVGAGRGTALANILY